MVGLLAWFGAELVTTTGRSALRRAEVHVLAMRRGLDR
jgi:hypothetical protein